MSSYPKNREVLPMSLPSPPHSSCGDENPTHFDALTLQQLSTSLPENYTIDHSIQRRQSEASLGSVASNTTKNDKLHCCDLCGKAYKHPACLAKHRWEHSDEWALTSQWLLTKHQQVQMLEAAAILVSMDKNPSFVSSVDAS
ncbi:hypothetical protein CLU79DRAFT_753691 [Phycomyces nitens]|nr:hypothetical protein CLU79DRAFT_753691 [Phycomyces nitens]